MSREQKWKQAVWDNYVHKHPELLKEPTMRKQWSNTVRRILAKKQHYICPHCFTELPSTWELDHIIPLHVGGEDVIGNLQILCPTCHRKKTQREMLRYYEIKRKLPKAYRRTSAYFDTLDPKMIHEVQSTWVALERIAKRNRIQTLKKILQEYK